VPLISPPPHHDIYSIEDLAQLIWDLKEVNPRCRVSVKLVAQPGIGTIACGVVKGGADVVLVCGGDGGTGASALGSLKHTGFPWELALPETHQALTASGLRSRTRLRVDGGLKNGHDVVIAALLGAEEFDFGTAALVALGCVMARQCHMNTCPVGIATQDPALRRKFRGTPQQLAEYLRSVGRQVRRLLAEMGYRKLDRIVGRTDLLAEHSAIIEARGLDLSPILNPEAPKGLPLASDRNEAIRGLGSRRSLDEEILDEVHPKILGHGQAVVQRTVRNTDRAVGTRLSGELAFLYGSGNFRGHIQLRLRGVAGQSLGAFRNSGASAVVEGVGNHGCEYMTRGTVIVLGDIGRNFGAGMTGGVAYLLPDSTTWREHLNQDYVRAEPTGRSDENLLLRLLREHVFHCGSVIGQKILDQWDTQRPEFRRIVPLAQDIVDFRAIYDQQVAARMGVLLNE
jgi:glutamate synthase domain-containing protein 3